MEEEHKPNVHHEHVPKEHTKHEVHKEHHKVHEHKPFESKPVSHKSKKSGFNYWILTTLVLAVLFIVAVTVGFGDHGISKQEASDKTLEFINTNLLQGGTEATLNSIEDSGDLYSLKIDVAGQEVDSYVTKDGKLFFPQAIDMEETLDAPASPTDTQANEPAASSVEKSDKPKVELFVMSHCPYGTQSEKGILPAIEQLGDTVDFEVKFVNYAMHGEKEVLEEMNQVCIKGEQNDKYFDYLKCFLAAGDGESCLAEVGIDTDALETCVSALDEEYGITASLADQSTWSGGRYPPFVVYDAENKEYGVRGSPTLVINGAQASSARSPAAYLSTICAAFNEAPAECDAELSSAQASPGFGGETDSGATAATCG